MSIALIIVLQLLLSLKIKGKTLYGQDNLEQTAHIDADIVFLGSSRCWKHFDPIFFDTTFHVKSLNLGVDGHEELTMMIFRLENYLSKNLPPKFVIINIDPICTGGSFDNNESFALKNMFARYAFLSDKKDQPLLDYFKFNFSERYVPLYAAFKYNIIMDCFLRHPMAANYLKCGYDGRDEKWDTVSDPVCAIQHYDLDSAREISLAWALDSLNKICINNNSKLICIQTPLYKTLDCEASTPKIAQMCTQQNIPFIDTNIAAIKDSIQNFYNHTHLNIIGIHKLNAFMAKDSVLISFLHTK